MRECVKIAEEIAISPKENEISTTFDVIKSLVCRAEYLDHKGLLTPCVDDPCALLVQLLADASQIFKARNTNATAMVLKPIYDDRYMTEEDKDLVNNRFNLVLVALYRKDDSYKNLCSHAAYVAQQIETIREQGITVNDNHWQVKMPVGGDMNIMSAMLGLCGCSSEWPCVFLQEQHARVFLSIRLDGCRRDYHRGSWRSICKCNTFQWICSMCAPPHIAMHRSSRDQLLQMQKA
jgi:hypothetical protein